MAQIAVMAVMALMALNEGAQKRKQKVLEAEGLDAAANRVMATTTAEMAEEERLKEQMESRAIAVAASSGAGVDDPTIVQLIGDLNAEGTYRIMARLWVGEDKAEGLRYASDAARREGESALNASYVKAAQTVMSGVSGMGGGASGSSAKSVIPTMNSGINTSSLGGSYGSQYNPFLGVFPSMGG